MTEPMNQQERYERAVAELDRVGILLRESRVALSAAGDKYAAKMEQLQTAGTTPALKRTLSDTQIARIQNTYREELRDLEQNIATLRGVVTQVEEWHGSALDDARQQASMVLRS